jgi:hypothetical protein
VINKMCDRIKPRYKHHLTDSSQEDQIPSVTHR